MIRKGKIALEISSILQFSKEAFISDYTKAGSNSRAELGG